MSDIRTIFISYEKGADWLLQQPSLAGDDGLDTAVILSLFSDARARAGDDTPAPDDLRGWWGDAFAAKTGDRFGSRLWLLGRRKQLPSVLAEAKGAQEKGLAEARVIEATADANEKQGLADAKVLEERLLAQARGEAQVGATKATVTRDVGQSEADVLRDKLFAEAKGLTEKFSALASLSDQARSHEEFRMQLEKNFEEAMAAIAANKDIAKDQAEVLATALAKAKIEIVGGEGDFFNSFAKSLSVGKAIEGVVGKSPVVQDVLARLLNGKPAERKADVEVPAAEA